MRDELEADTDPAYIINYIKGVHCKEVFIIIPHIMDSHKHRSNRTIFKYRLNRFKACRAVRSGYIIPIFKNGEIARVKEALKQVRLKTGAKCFWGNVSKDDFLENWEVYEWGHDE